MWKLYDRMKLHLKRLPLPTLENIGLFSSLSQWSPRIRDERQSGRAYQIGRALVRLCDMSECVLCIQGMSMQWSRCVGMSFVFHLAFSVAFVLGSISEVRASNPTSLASKVYR